MTDLEASVQGERIMWHGKPQFKCFVLEAIFNPMLIFALVWGAIDGAMMLFVFSDSSFMGDFGKFGTAAMLGFFALHLMPVWIYLFGVIFSALKYKHTEYIITERGIYISGGLFSVNIQMKPFTDLSHINIHRGVFDRMLGVGDVYMICNHTMYNTSNHNHNHVTTFNICDVEDYQKVFGIIKEMQTDIYSDTMYPNAMRPDTNPGYNTKYDKEW